MVPHVNILWTIKTPIQEKLNSLSTRKDAEEDRKIPDNVFIGQLSVDHIDLIYSMWTHSDVYPKSDLWETVRLNIGLFAFSRHNGELFAA
ncbi:N-acetyltransferase domain-containing protein [Aphis craccivora]|uniref:N-acetyltransferase domain-containing protein n=1 Tax=Aphis craccivora TaxID=307492 RepID=A0A6G0YG91_APHCR|nr:N-acetyltransferase domain-containing protein [Aphis craccivora]